MMKKLVKLIAVVMLVAMLFSVLPASAFAISSDDEDTTFTSGDTSTLSTNSDNSNSSISSPTPTDSGTSNSTISVNQNTITAIENYINSNASDPYIENISNNKSYLAYIIDNTINCVDSNSWSVGPYFDNAISIFGKAVFKDILSPMLDAYNQIMLKDFSDLTDEDIAFRKFYVTVAKKVGMATPGLMMGTSQTSTITSAPQTYAATNYDDYIVISDSTHNSSNPFTDKIEVTGGKYTFRNIALKGAGFDIQGGTVVIDGCYVANATALKVTGGTVTVNGSTFDNVTDKNPNNVVDISGTSSSVNIASNSVIKAYGAGNAINISGGTLTSSGTIQGSNDTYAINLTSGTATLKSGTVSGGAGVYVAIGATLNVTGAQITAINGTRSSSTLIGTPVFCGAGVVTSSGTVSVSGGKITSSCTGAIVSLDLSKQEAQGTCKANVTVRNPSSMLSNGADYSNYKSAVAEVGGKQYSSLSAAVGAANNGETVKLLDDTTITAQISSGKTITIDGAGHKISSSVSAIKNTGDLTLQNVSIDMLSTQNANAVENSNELTLKNVTINNCAGTCVETTAGNTYIEGLTTNASSGTGLVAKAGMTTVTSADIKCAKSIDASNANIKVVQGTFADSKGDGTITSGNYAAEGTSYTYSSGVGTYTPNSADYSITVVNGGASSGGENYVKYVQNSTKKISFKTNKALKEIGYIDANGNYNALTTNPSSTSPSSPGKEPELVLSAAPFETIDPGMYQMVFKFDNGVQKRPFKLAVIPESYSVSTGKTTTYEKSTIAYYETGSSQYIDISIYTTDATYSATNECIALKPNKILLSTTTSISDGIDVGYSAPTSGKGIKDDPYTYSIQKGFADSMPTGLNYVLIVYDDLILAKPVKFGNAVASMTPESGSWSSLSSALTFKVYPDITSLKLGDTLLTEKDDYTYNTKTHVLTLLNSKMANVAYGSYKLTATTSAGTVGADIKVGSQLKAKTVDYHVINGTADLTFVASDPIKEGTVYYGYKDKIAIPAEYIKYNNSKEFTISANFLNQLSTLGTYYIGCDVDPVDTLAGTTELLTVGCTFRIVSAYEAAYTPDTGDTYNRWIYVAIVVLVAVLFVTILLPKIKAMKKEVVDKVSADTAKKNTKIKKK